MRLRADRFFFAIGPERYPTGSPKSRRNSHEAYQDRIAAPLAHTHAVTMSIARASLVMIAALIASRILGWLRLSVFGAAFGETPQLDAFWAAFRIPDALFNLVVAGRPAPAVIPGFAGYLPNENHA